MPILTVSELTKTYGGEVVLEGVTFSVEPKEKVALVGRNGSGKTTLLRIIVGLEDFNRGSVTRAPWAKPAYLAQIPEGRAGDTVRQRVLSGAADVRALEARLRELEARMASPEVHDDPLRLAPVMEEYGTVHDHFVHAGGFSLEARAGMVLSGLGFGDTAREQPIGTLSGGWRVRTELARALLSEPDLLLLDEPTNHLDLGALEWLEEYLRAFPGAVIVVSHDRHLMDAIAARTLELNDHRVASYPGGYSAYARLKAEQLGRQRELQERQREEIARLDAYIRRYRAGNRATMAKSREKMLGRVREHLVHPPREAKEMRVNASPAVASGKTVATLRRVGKRYDHRDILQDVDLLLFRGDRIGLLGPNGAGKSTLLKIIAGLEPPTAGRVTLGTNTQPAYVAQEPTTALDPSKTVLDEVLADRPMTPEMVRTYLGRFLFSGEDVYKQISMLSGGERQRLSLARLLLDGPNLLLLDEPTNHLDIPSREALEAALQEFTGTVVVATHDRYLLDRLATRIFSIQDGKVADFHGSYGELRQRQRRDAAARDRSGTHETRRRTQEAPRQPSGEPTAPTFEDIAAGVAAAEAERDDAGRRLGDPELYRDPERVKAMRQRYDDAERRLEALYAALESLEGSPG